MYRSMGSAKWNKCTTCGENAAFQEADKCTNCWEVEKRLEKYLQSNVARDVMRAYLDPYDKADGWEPQQRRPTVVSYKGC